MADSTATLVRHLFAPARMVFAISGKAYVYQVTPHIRSTVEFYLKNSWHGKLLQYLRLLDRDRNAEAMMALELSLENPNDIADAQP